MTDRYRNEHAPIAPTFTPYSVAMPPAPKPAPIADQGHKADLGKPDFSLLPLEALIPVIRVMEFGNTKYERDSWQHIPDAHHRLFAAMMRHLAEHQRGVRIDSESGQPHMAHAATNALFLLWFLQHPQGD